MILPELISSIRDRHVILFVGAGISRNLGLPDYRELVGQIGKELGFDEEIFETFGDYQMLSEYYVLERGKIGPLRSWMDTTWHPNTIDIRKSPIHNLIVDLDFPIIYTTNFDRWLELAFQARGKPVRKVASVGDLVKPHYGETEIIKFHGDFEDDRSIVLTETSFFQRMGFETPLDLRLRSDSLACPILFIGYSLRDLNMRFLMYKLQQLWQDSPSPEQRPKSYILMTRPNPVQEAVLRRRGVQPILSEAEDPGTAVVNFLQDLLDQLQPPASDSSPDGKRATLKACTPTG